MNIDKEIKKALAEENTHLNDVLLQEPGLFKRIANSFHGNMKKWLMLVFVLTLACTAIFIYCAYHFVMAINIDDRIYWGVWFIVSFSLQVALKMWSYMEINRHSTIREVKRVELAVERLEATLNKNTRL